jgi:hypothetical protein
LNRLVRAQPRASTPSLLRQQTWIVLRNAEPSHSTQSNPKKTIASSLQFDAKQCAPVAHVFQQQRISLVLRAGAPSVAERVCVARGRRFCWFGSIRRRGCRGRSASGGRGFGLRRQVWREARDWRCCRPRGGRRCSGGRRHIGVEAAGNEQRAAGLERAIRIELVDLCDGPGGAR